MAPLIQLAEDIMAKAPLLPFKAVETKFSSPAALSGVQTAGMPAAQAFLDLCREIDLTMRAYANLVRSDAEKLDKIIEGFSASDS